MVRHISRIQALQLTLQVIFVVLVFASIATIIYIVAQLLLRHGY